MAIIFYTPNNGGFRGCKILLPYFTPPSKVTPPTGPYRANQLGIKSKPFIGQIEIVIVYCLTTA